MLAVPGKVDESFVGRFPIPFDTALMIDRPLIRDWILLFVCGWILAQTHWPGRVVVHAITYRLADGSTVQGVLHAGSAQLRIIQDRIERWDDDVESNSMVIARWRRELADFYSRSGSRRTVDRESPVSQASFEPNPIARPEPSIRLDCRYWAIVRDTTDEWIRSQESAIAGKLQSRGEVPVQIGPAKMVRPRSGWAGVAATAGPMLLAGMLATGMCLWSLTNPAILLGGPKDIASSGPKNSDPTNSDPKNTARQSGRRTSRLATVDRIPIEIPARWVRVHQPPGVKLRQVSFTVIVLAALVVQLSALV